MNFSNSLYETLNAIAEESKIADALVARMYRPDFATAVAYKKGELSFVPQEIADRAHNGPDLWEHPNRVSGKVGRIARQLVREDVLRFDIEDRDFEIFASKLKASDISESGQFAMAEGDDIAKWYNESSYAHSDCGTLTRSCMRYDKCGVYMDIYTKNPDVCKMLILTNSETGKLHGRALVWYTNDMVLMDRVYGNETVIEAFREYANENGWYYRTRNSYDNETQFTLNKKNKTVTVKIPTKFNRARYYPYVDTFKYYNKTEGWLSNDYNSNYEYRLESTSGSYSRR